MAHLDQKLGIRGAVLEDLRERPRNRLEFLLLHVEPVLALGNHHVVEQFLHGGQVILRQRHLPRHVRIVSDLKDHFLGEVLLQEFKLEARFNGLRAREVLEVEGRDHIGRHLFALNADPAPHLRVEPHRLRAQPGGIDKRLLALQVHRHLRLAHFGIGGDLELVQLPGANLDLAVRLRHFA